MRKLYLLLIASLMVVLAVPAFADESIQMAATGGSGITGTAKVTALGNNQIRVEVTLNGLPANDQRAGHIHKGTCANQGGVVYPLNPLMVNAQGVGTSNTTVTLDKEPITAGGYYINFHQALNPPGPGVSCGNITKAYNAQTTAAGQPTNLPRTGDQLLLGGAAVAAVALIAAGYVLRRRSI